MIGRTTRDVSAKWLKSIAKSGLDRLIENQAVGPVRAALVPRPGRRVVRPATPPGGGRREQSMPPTQRPICLSGPARSEK